ncbi:dihydrofolate reductase family protein [Actinomadura hibisca]|uniref:dihydrofolate reductase family protein n=1 Tax=Actinomadura hibisca TaxID=68565 RepID=UPI000836F09E|nr:dihydrofolate reductase family protein [Actinomadura hibisca]
MGKIYTAATMSLDGYISGPGETGFDHLFRWFSGGDVEVRTTDPNLTFHLTEQSAAAFLPSIEATGALVVGRRLFDLTGGWGGRHTMDKPVVVLTHRVPDKRPGGDDDFVFVTGGIEEAVDTARRLAGDLDVGVNGGGIASQCLDAGLLEEIRVSVAPVLLGGGVPFFDALKGAPVELEGPVDVVREPLVTHLTYRVTPSGGR